MIPCPHCHNLHLHRVGCPSPDLLPRYANRTDPARCPDCSSLRPGVHRAGCCVAEPHDAVTVFLIEPHEPGAEPLEVLVSDEDVEAAR